METQPGIRWSAYSKHVDIDTGEVLTEKKAKQDYILIKTDKHVEVNHIQTRGHIEYTKQYRRNPQTKLFS